MFNGIAVKFRLKQTNLNLRRISPVQTAKIGRSDSEMNRFFAQKSI
jgi:hypothetical protein